MSSALDPEDLTTLDSLDEVLDLAKTEHLVDIIQGALIVAAASEHYPEPFDAIEMLGTTIAALAVSKYGGDDLDPEVFKLRVEVCKTAALAEVSAALDAVSAVYGVDTRRTMAAEWIVLRLPAIAIAMPAASA